MRAGQLLLDDRQDATNLGEKVVRVLDEKAARVAAPAALDARVESCGFRRRLDAKPDALIAVAVGRRSQVDDRGIACLARKAATEDDVRRLGREPDVLAERAARHLERRGLAGARTSRDDDSLHGVTDQVQPMCRAGTQVAREDIAMDMNLAKARFVVLAAVDDSPLRHEVVRVGANLARTAVGGELHLVCVVEDAQPPVSVVPTPVGLGLTTAEIVSAARKRLDTITAEARAQFRGRIVEHLAAGSAWKQILQLAIDLQADVLLVGTHGRTGIKRFVLGSVAEAVVRRASCPVIVVRPKDYHAFVPPEIEPACPECLQTQRETNGVRLWCEQHGGGDARRGHIHYEARP